MVDWLFIKNARKTGFYGRFLLSVFLLALPQMEWVDYRNPL